MLIIGSYALRRIDPILLVRQPKDIDIVVTPREFAELTKTATYIREKLYRLPTGQLVDVNIAGPGTAWADYHAYAVARLRPHAVDELGGQSYIAGHQMMYAIKRSHRHRPRNWQKHILDYDVLRWTSKLQNGPLEKPIVLARTLLKISEKQEAEYPPLKTPSLNKSVEDFFDDRVSNRIFIHDEIHAVMAHEDRPMYERIRLAPGVVACSEEKFERLARERQNMCVLEEAYVIALERCLLPMLFDEGPHVTEDDAFEYALMRIGTTLCSGWFREYVTDHYSDILLDHNASYLRTFLDAYDKGAIVPIARKTAA
jgi:hypothetical protein